MSQAIFRVHSDDSVAVALRDVAVGETVAVAGQAELSACASIQRGHKMALQRHQTGDLVIRYGQPIGRATANIAPGDWVHSHNLATTLNTEMGLADSAGSLYAHGKPCALTWRGYVRTSGAATRNEIWVIPTVGCVARTAEQAALQANIRHSGRIDGIYAFTHPFGCSQLGNDLGGTRAILASLACNPNAAGVVFIGLGCESNQLTDLIDTLPNDVRARIRTVVAQFVTDEADATARAINDLVEEATTARRTELPLSELAVGLKCGGSDGLSGLTANPLLGRLTETLTASGGRAILTEIPEIFGAEQLLLGRSTNDAVSIAGHKLVADFKRYFVAHGESVSENPSPGNITGGITTLEEKSLGAVQKAGRAALVDTIHYGDRIKRPGLTLLQAPGNDAVSSTALAAAGANMILFTTGRGTPLGFPVPTVKVASNSELAQHKSGWIDFDASPALTSDLAALDAAFLDTIIAIASGEPCAAERNGQREIAIWKRGVTL